MADTSWIISGAAIGCKRVCHVYHNSRYLQRTTVPYSADSSDFFIIGTIMHIPPTWHDIIHSIRSGAAIRKKHISLFLELIPTTFNFVYSAGLSVFQQGQESLPSSAHKGYWIYCISSHGFWYDFTKKKNAWIISISGHTFNRGNSGYTLQLSISLAEPISKMVPDEPCHTTSRAWIHLKLRYDNLIVTMYCIFSKLCNHRGELCVYDYLSMLELMLYHVSKSGPSSPQ